VGVENNCSESAVGRLGSVVGGAGPEEAIDSESSEVGDSSSDDDGGDEDETDFHLAAREMHGHCNVTP
jgi:hypothetical protein